MICKKILCRVTSQGPHWGSVHEQIRKTNITEWSTLQSRIGMWGSSLYSYYFASCGAKFAVFAFIFFFSYLYCRHHSSLFSFFASIPLYPYGAVYSVVADFKMIDFKFRIRNIIHKFHCAERTIDSLAAPVRITFKLVMRFAKMFRVTLSTLASGKIQYGGSFCGNVGE